MNKHIVSMNQGGHIALHHIPCPESQADPIIVTHGTISNGESVQPLAEYLVSQGYDCWILEWGGHGHSKAARRNQDFEYPALNDIPTAINTVLSETGKKRIHWVSHSGGGHLALMYLCRLPKQRAKIASLVSLGAQATDGANGFKLKFRAIGLYTITRIFGRTPKAIVSVGTEGEPSLLLAQWAKWNLTKRWKGSDGLDYLKKITELEHPSLIICGSADDIAPVTGCHKIYHALGSTQKDWIECGKSHGFSKDFTHGQLVRGRSAQQEIFPKIGEWLNELASSIC